MQPPSVTNFLAQERARLPGMNRSSFLHIIAEFGPVFAFFISGQFTDFFGAALVLVISTVFACVVMWLLDRHIPVVPLVSAVFVIGGGSLTLYLQNPDALILADTVFYLTMAIAIIVPLWRGWLIMKSVFGNVFAITDEGWRKLSLRWFYFLILAALANDAVRILFTPEVWIDYRFFKVILVTAFAFYQFTLSSNYRIDGEANKLGLRITHAPTRPSESTE